MDPRTPYPYTRELSAATKVAGTIACIGWGSLIHNPGTLPCRGAWKFDGPMLPIEFARESASQAITLVISPASPRVRTCWTVLDIPDVDSARQALGLREYPAAKAKWIQDYIGFSDATAKLSFGLEADTITSWLESRGLSGAVWTNLPCKFNQQNGVMPTAEQVVTYLESLKGPAREAAEVYVRSAPAQIDTPYRRLIADKLGWTALTQVPPMALNPGEGL